jgi:hypothetical protein
MLQNCDEIQGWIYSKALNEIIEGEIVRDGIYEEKNE